MSPVVNGRVIFNSIPEAFPEPGKSIIYDASQTIDPETVPLDGGFLLKVLEVSVDPYMRGKMRDPTTESYSASYTLHEPVYGYGIAVVVRSENPEVKVGDHIYGAEIEHQNYVIKKALNGFALRKIENKYNLPWSTFVGILGMPGKTAYIAWKEYSRAKKSETVFVTVGAGPVGSLVIQLAKEEGLKVIASAGSEEKIQFMKECGADVVFNYKTTDTAAVLKKEGPIDVYWDSVGGSTLEAALDAASVGARFIMCGMISGYNGAPQPINNMFHVFSKSITMQGFIVSRIQEKYEEEFYATVAPKVASGAFKHREEVVQGLGKVGDTIIAVQRGTNKGKTVVHVADD